MMERSDAPGEAFSSEMRAAPPRQGQRPPVKLAASARDPALLDAIPLGFCVVEVVFDRGGAPVDCTFVETNPAFEAQTGLHDALGHSARQLVPGVGPQWFEFVGEVATRGAPARMEGYVSGLDRWFELHAARVDAPERRRVAVFLKNISDRKRAERELQERAELEEKLISIVSHDLRTPVSAIQLGTALLLHGPSLSAEDRRVVARIRSSAQRTERMIRDLLDFSRFRSGEGIPIRTARVDVSEMVREVLSELLAVHPHRAVVTQLGSGALVEGDPDRLQQVIENLVCNAFKYSPEASPVGVSTHAEGDGVTLRVHNHGTPIPPEQRNRLFEAFFRGSGGVDNGDRSLGLGLYIVRHLVTAHRGGVEVESTAAAGTTFTVRLPRRRSDR